MDLDMPVLDGPAALRALKSDPHTFRIPIIVLTRIAPDTRTKPIVPNRLVERIREVLGPVEPHP